LKDWYVGGIFYHSIAFWLDIGAVMKSNEFWAECEPLKRDFYS